MPQLEAWAEQQPDATALYFPQSDERVSYHELDTRSRRAAHWLIDHDLEAGDHIVVLMENRPAIFEIAWAAIRAGLYYTVASTHLQGEELGYILDNSGARLLITSAAMAESASAALAHATANDIPCYSTDGQAQGPQHHFHSYAATVAAYDGSRPLPARPLGQDLLYSSGTTGQPKGVTGPLVPYAERNTPDPGATAMQQVFGFDDDTVYLSPAPLYHAAPLRFSMLVLRCGGTVMVLRHFDPHSALSAIQDHGVTHSQWVPTMFIRMLDLPEAQRRAYDVSSIRVAIHAAAPCPIHIKEQMIGWWGPVLWEYYAGSEGVGMTLIDSEAWLSHKGSVGPAVIGTVHVLGEDRQPLPRGEVGLVCFSGGPQFEYHNAPDKTRESYLDDDMATYGDLGYLDDDGFLYLSDRRADLVISGGVNIYPKEIEDVLQRHPSVADCAVTGVPDREFGETVKAFVRLYPDCAAPDHLDQELIAFCREHMAHLKAPKTVAFLTELPRTETGKLLRRVLKTRHA